MKTAIGWVINILQRGVASMKRINDILDTPVEINDDEVTQEVNKLYGDIEFRDLSFTYPNDSIAESAVKRYLKDPNLSPLVERIVRLEITPDEVWAEAVNEIGKSFSLKKINPPEERRPSVFHYYKSIFAIGNESSRTDYILSLRADRHQSYQETYDDLVKSFLRNNTLPSPLAELEDLERKMLVLEKLENVSKNKGKIESLISFHYSDNLLTFEEKRRLFRDGVYVFRLYGKKADYILEDVLERTIKSSFSVKKVREDSITPIDEKTFWSLGVS